MKHLFLLLALTPFCFLVAGDGRKPQASTNDSTITYFYYPTKKNPSLIYGVAGNPDLMQAHILYKQPLGCLVLQSNLYPEDHKVLFKNLIAQFKQNPSQSKKNQFQPKSNPAINASTVSVTSSPDTNHLILNNSQYDVYCRADFTKRPTDQVIACNICGVKKPSNGKFDPTNWLMEKVSNFKRENPHSKLIELIPLVNKEIAKYRFIRSSYILMDLERMHADQKGEIRLDLTRAPTDYVPAADDKKEKYAENTTRITKIKNLDGWIGYSYSKCFDHNTLISVWKKTGKEPARYHAYEDSFYHNEEFQRRRIQDFVHDLAQNPESLFNMIKKLYILQETKNKNKQKDTSNP